MDITVRRDGQEIEEQIIPVKMLQENTKSESGLKMIHRVLELLLMCVKMAHLPH